MAHYRWHLMRVDSLPTNRMYIKISTQLKYLPLTNIKALSGSLVQNSQLSFLTYRNSTICNNDSHSYLVISYYNFNTLITYSLIIPSFNTTTDVQSSIYYTSPGFIHFRSYSSQIFCLVHVRLHYKVFILINFGSKPAPYINKLTDIPFTEVLTGHNKLNKHLHTMGVTASPNCNECDDPETSEHFLCKCPAYIMQRAIILGAYILPYRSIQSLAPSAILKFMNDTKRI